MDKPKNTINSFKKELIKKQWVESLDFSAANQPPDIIIENILALEQKNMFSNDIIIICRLKDFSAIYVSKNVHKILGYTQEEFIREDMYFNIANKAQPDFFQKVLKWSKDFHNFNPKLKSPFIKARGYYAGKIYTHKDGTQKQFLKRLEIHYGENISIPETAVMILEEATHLFKEKDYWAFLQKYTETDIISRFYKSDDIDDKLISEREKEILILIASGKTSKEVAKILNISPETVSQHRKNMIRKTNAKDTSSLIQLCKICEVI